MSLADVQIWITEWLQKIQASNTRGIYLRALPQNDPNKEPLLDEWRQYGVILNNQAGGLMDRLYNWSEYDLANEDYEWILEMQNALEVGGYNKQFRTA